MNLDRESVNGACQAAAYFQTLDIDVTEGAALVTMIDNGDGQAGYCQARGQTYHICVLR